jgi:hypothetical protein
MHRWGDRSAISRSLVLSELANTIGPLTKRRDGRRLSSFGSSPFVSDSVGALARGLVRLRIISAFSSSPLTLFFSSRCGGLPSRSSCQGRLHWVCRYLLPQSTSLRLSIIIFYFDSASSNWLNNFAVGMSTPDFVTAAPYGVYIFLGLMCILGTLYVYFLVPETKNRTLDEMDELFGKSDRGPAPRSQSDVIPSYQATRVAAPKSRPPYFSLLCAMSDSYAPLVWRIRLRLRR